MREVGKFAETKKLLSASLRTGRDETTVSRNSRLAGGTPDQIGRLGGGQPMSSFALFTLRKPALEGEKSELPAR
ncbi:hypothetical protein A3D84_04695 [Candidatus Woesebacteria bacterium RIFCSPHIGHO2_02_FULL_42_20]|uniref:Uncharacterized protein n=1 Tax=Candidatus Woesebacteria bacterium RIFCSPHIGHO2_12_FULL_41_24 TaxID=1802510 RepID=A0A1F8AUX8_9BACT|nr:MAG: hypothetical protein A2W15_00195 [Candidatus Woesebacteria bacterium RBG_16_41_13]OGM30992.1 MAG: hypothetical protein A2873_01825 [Candidatus Woesebacteria bacterium RIFCSPHIGHO2_01_FULL_42_80]OGM34478.1 MAG: hypothetical protein A3D84_04695 [Candidatus Woesebacteria bacterium RIFCSPHIGHO2_02_FULL_42_20]OGM55562.1 MAG: hypothetical protein A3E44_04835 [Candidatus Woesebacteria bacterium RIFCSPHIGHO2_12_FULL_41_24]OGM67361.1 MAG: hypothetical protein A2969_02880 [Candidatus Woesebacteri